MSTDLWSDMHDSGIKQNPISGVLVYNLRNRFISTRLSVIQNQHRRLVVGHPVLQDYIRSILKNDLISVFAHFEHASNFGLKF